jgi:hypothetical protein
MTPTDDPKYGPVRIEAVQRCELCRGEGRLRRARAGTGPLGAGGYAVETCPICDGAGERRTPLLLPGEPFFLIRAKDETAPKMVDIYAIIAEPAEDAGATRIGEWTASLRRRRDAMIEWQHANPGLVRPPD